MEVCAYLVTSKQRRNWQGQTVETMISLKGGLILEAERLVDDKPETKPVLSNTSFRQEISIFLRSFNVLEGGTATRLDAHMHVWMR